MEENKDSEQQYSPNVVSYLGFIQGVINRMASVSATIKGLSMTVFAGVIAIVFAVGLGEAGGLNKIIALVVVLAAVLVCGGFDTYYFYEEKQYRELYSRVLSGEHECNFDMRPPKYKEITPWDAIKRFPIWAFYGVMLLVLAIMFVLVAAAII